MGKDGHRRQAEIGDQLGDTAGRRPNFYGRRTGRTLRAARRDLLRTELPRLRIPVPEPGAPALELKSLFPRPVDEVWLEIGFGGGEHLAAQAERHPEIGFIGSELFVNGIARLVAAVADGGLDNVRIFDEDARLLLPALPEAGLGRAFVLFPDPWPKHRHAARRFVSRANLEALAFALADGAELWLASDDMGQARWILAQATAHPAFRWLAARARDWRAPPAGWRATRYEEKGIKAGRKPLYFRFERRPRDAESAHKRG